MSNCIRVYLPCASRQFEIARMLFVGQTWAHIEQPIQPSGSILTL
jgi:hypothetical protein